MFLLGYYMNWSLPSNKKFLLSLSRELLEVFHFPTQSVCHHLSNLHAKMYLNNYV
jgi:hypothetical protein